MVVVMAILLWAALHILRIPEQFPVSLYFFIPFVLTIILSQMNYSVLDVEEAAV